MLPLSGLGSKANFSFQTIESAKFGGLYETQNFWVLSLSLINLN